MHPADWRLLNAESIEAIPAALARARGNAAARRLAAADWLIRRKRDGCFLATRCADRLCEFERGALTRELHAELHELAANSEGAVALRALDGLHRHLGPLGLSADYGARSGLPLQPEPTVLAWAGRDRYLRPVWLVDAAARAWQRMRDEARRQEVSLDAISGYRSHAYQLGIFRRKLARGQALDDILRVNAAPGYSEHHSGEALDLGTRGEPPAEESFEHTAAFDWLGRHAATFGFRMSYPRDNPHGIVFEPWHWRWHATLDD